MKKMLFSLVFALLFMRGSGQNLDSLAVVREVDSLIQVSRNLRKMAKFQQALEVANEANRITLEQLGSEHLFYADCQHEIGVVYTDLGKFDLAEQALTAGANLRVKNLGKTHQAYSTSLNSLGILYSKSGKYDAAEAVFLEAKKINEEKYGKRHFNYAMGLQNLGVVYKSTGRFEDAETLYRESLAILKDTLKENHPLYALVLMNLGVSLYERGKYWEAEPLYLAAIQSCEQAFGKKHFNYYQPVLNLGVLYQNIGLYEESFRLLQEAKAVSIELFGNNHYTTGQVESMMGLCYQRMGDLEQADMHHQEGKAIFAKAFGTEHQRYAQSIANLAFVHLQQEKMAEALAAFNESLSIYERISKTESLDYATCKLGVGRVYEMSENPTAAEENYQNAVEILKKIGGENHDEYKTATYTLAAFYQKEQKSDRAAECFQSVGSLAQKNYQNAALYSSEFDLLAYQKLYSKELNHYFSFVADQPFGSFLVDQACNTALLTKNFLLESKLRLQNAVAQSDSATIDVYHRWLGTQRRLAAEYAKPGAERKNVAAMETRANDFEKQLVRSVNGFGEVRRQVTWQEVQQTLQPHEAIIEFIHFRYYSPNGKNTDSTYYAAFLLKPAWPQPLMVGLFEEKAIQPLLNSANTQLYAARGDKKRGQPEKSEGIVVGIGESASLYQLIWQPLDSLLQGATTVYFSPSGLLHRLNLGAVPIPGSDQVLGDQYKLVQLGSTRQLVVGSSSSSGSKTAALFGGLKYDLAETATASATATATATATYDVASLRRSLGARGGDTWDYLPGTEKEAQSVGKTLSKSGYSVQTFTSNDGTETAFKSLGTNKTSSPAVLHIATHGFFFPDPKDTVNRASFAVDHEPVFKTSDNPLMRSGLILSGANRAWAGGKTPEGQQDGILTAYEISQMNLSSTELVVLSACETGLGDVSGNEGVYGLQRAFKIAGAKYLVMSLWQVPDKETSEFMSSFYKKWLEEKMEIPDAFRAAQKEMRDQGFDPYQWAGFVLVE